MKIALIDIDSKMPNLSLHKIAKYHVNLGDEVIWNPLPLWLSNVDKVYVSCIFDKNREKAARWEGLAEIGGSGYSLTKILPPEIEAVKPRINLGFTTRGCIRQCPFCIVPEKEGEIRIVGDLLDLWDGKSKTITVLDNNILAIPEHFSLICQQARENSLLIDFNQGLDHRLLNDDIARELQTIRHREYRFAFDDIADLGTVIDTLRIIQEYKLGRAFWYVLVGFDSTFTEDYERVMFLRKHNQTVFVMRYRNTPGNMLLARWANQPAIFKGMSFTAFLRVQRNQLYYERHRDAIEAYLGNEAMPLLEGK